MYKTRTAYMGNPVKVGDLKNTIIYAREGETAEAAIARYNERRARQFANIGKAEDRVNAF